MNIVATALERARKPGESWVALARRLGTTDRTLHRIRGGARPSLDTLLLLEANGILKRNTTLQSLAAS